MTSRQIYAALMRIAGTPFPDGKPFLQSEKFHLREMRKIQSDIRALLEKINYQRAYRDLDRPRRAARVVELPDSFYNDFQVEPQDIPE